ncbi:MAG: hypothetical protein ACRD9Y_21790, partial [Blastocatellia bacterium]
MPELNAIGLKAGLQTFPKEKIMRALLLIVTFSLILTSAASAQQPSATPDAQQPAASTQASAPVPVPE